MTRRNEGARLRHESVVEVHAPLGHVWRVLADVRRWPEWTASMRVVDPLRSGPLGVGSRVRVKQPRIPTATWRITRYDPPVRFDWEARVIGVRLTATHSLTETTNGHVLLALSIELAGPLVRLLGRRIAVTARRNLDLESAGLKTASKA
ncbi:MAG: SRPBCC family protein [Actinoallomurus sp.]